MSLFSALSDSVRATTALARHGVDRVRLEAKLRTLERRRNQSLEELGRRVRELSVAGEFSDDRLTTELADVAAAEMRIAACQAEIDEVAADIAPGEKEAAASDVADTASDTADTPSDPPKAADAPGDSATDAPVPATPDSSPSSPDSSSDGDRT